MRDIPYQISSDAILGSCDVSLYKSVFLYAENKYFEITPANYVLQVDIGVPGKCLIGFTKFGSDKWLLGDVFIRNFYTIWNEETDKIGFVPHITSTANIRSSDPGPVEGLVSESDIFPVSNDVIVGEIMKIVGTQLGFGAIVSSFLMIFTTAFIGDFTGPARKLLASLLNIETSTKSIQPKKHKLREFDETVRDISI
jgi:hypothetical protein